MPVLNKFFANEKIEYYGVVGYADAPVVNARLAERVGNASSVIVFLLPYYTGKGKNISSYAVSKDYHIAIKRITDRLIAYLSEKFPGGSFFGFGDHSPINERIAAAKAGLGIIGENRLLINEKYGTYVFIAEVITDVAPELLGGSLCHPVLSCEGCGACKSACPTGALFGSADCLSEVTQKKGELSCEEASLLVKNNTVWGCDACQLACPHNTDAEKTPVPFFYDDRVDELSLNVLDSMSNEALAERAYAWRGRKTVERNLRIFENVKNDSRNGGGRE